MTECANSVDIAFVLDSSGSVRVENFVKMKEFVKNLVNKINVEEGASNLGVMTFSSEAQVGVNT